MADYATVDEIKSFATEADAIDDNAWAILASAASRLFDNLVEVEDDFFQEYDAVTPAGFTSRVFYGDGSAYLRLAPFTELNTVDPILIAGSVYSVPAYEVVDRNLIVLNRTKRFSSEDFIPYDRFSGWWDAVKITVSAKWGFSEIPNEVKFAVAMIAIAMFRQRDFANEITDGLKNVASFELPRTAQMIVDKYRERYSTRAHFA